MKEKKAVLEVALSAIKKHYAQEDELVGNGNTDQIIGGELVAGMVSIVANIVSSKKALAEDVLWWYITENAFGEGGLEYKGVPIKTPKDIIEVVN